MRRKTFDTLMSIAGLVLAAVLLVAGGLLVWANSFVSDQVHTQLAAQQIYFPKADDKGLTDPKIGPYLKQYAGQQLLTGDQAKAYADHYIAVHIEEMSGGKTYSQLSTESRANPDDQKLSALVNTVFKGETLRGMLLNAYAFGTMGKVALIGGIASFIGAAIMLVLALLGFAHRGRVPVDEELTLGARTPAPVER